MHDVTHHSEPAADERRVRTLVVAPAGYGKSRRLHAATVGRRRVAAPADLAELRAALADGDADSTVVVDHLHRWSDDDQLALARIVTFERPEPALHLAGRVCDRRLHDALVMVGADVVGTGELRVGAARLAELLDGAGLGDDQLHLVERLVDGWPVLAEAVVDHVTSTGTAHGLSVSHPLVAATVEDVLRDLGPDDAHLLGQLAQLRSFTQHVTDALSPGLLHRLRVAGIPIEASARHGVRLIDPVRETLRLRSTLDHELVPRTAVALVQAGLPLDACHLLIRIDQAERAAQILSGLTIAQLDTLAPTDLLATLELMPSQRQRFLRLHLARVRALGNAARLNEQLDAIDEAIEAAEAHGDEAVAVEARAERLFLEAMRARRDPELLREIDELEARATRGQTVTRLTEARSVVLAQSDEPADLERAVELSEHVGRSWEALGERIRAAHALRIRAMAMLMPVGRLADAEATIEHALHLTPTADLERLSSLLVAVRLSALLARPDPDRAAEASALADGLGLGWAQAYVAWSAALERAVEGDAAGARAAFERSWGLLGELRSHPTGVLLLAEVADGLARAGDLDGARELLGRAGEHAEHRPKELELAEVLVAARAGDDADLAGRLARLTERCADWAGWRWRVDLAAALAADDPVERAGWTERALRDVVGWADVSIVERLEPALVAELRAGLAPTAGERVDEPRSPAADPSRDDRPSPDRGELATVDAHGVPADVHVPSDVHVQVLGTFAVTVDGVPARITSDRVASLVKILAVGRGRVPVEVVIDRLWPDADPEAGRRRLKNVLTRTRSVVGPVIERHGDSLAFAPSVRLDLAEFATASRDAARALADGAPEAVAVSVRALTTFTGPLLPDDLYDDDVAPVRLAETGRAMTIVDGLLASSAGAAIGPMIHDAIVRIDPDDTARLERLVEWSIERGEPGLARAAALQLVSVTDELGVEPPRAVARLLAATP